MLLYRPAASLKLRSVPPAFRATVSAHGRKPGASTSTWYVPAWAVKA